MRSHHAISHELTLAPSGAGEGSWVPMARTVVTFALLVAARNKLYYLTDSLGLPPSDLGGWSIAYLLFGQTVVTILHELGHLGAAIAVGFRFNVINAGPVTVVRDAHGHQSFHFDLGRLFKHDGFLAAIPREPAGIRTNMILMIFAGPFLSLNLGALVFLTMLTTPGTALAPYGTFLGCLAVIFVLDFVVNLLPIGHCDGSMILHLAWNTSKGQRIIASMLSAMHSDRAEMADSMDARIAAHRMAITSSAAVGMAGTLQSALEHLRLGMAELQNEAHAAAETNLLKCLGVLQKLDANESHPLHWALCLDSLSRIHQVQGNAKESREAGEEALRHYAISRGSAAGIGALLEIYIRMADLQLFLRELGDAVATVDEALASLPGTAHHPGEVATLRRIRTSAILRSNTPEKAGDELTMTVAGLRDHSHFADPRQPLLELGELAVDLWEAGSEAKALELIRESVQGLEDCGARAEAGRMKSKQARLLLSAGLPAEAEAVLAGVNATPGVLKLRAEIARRAKRHDQALAAYSELIRVTQGDREVAGVKVSLALLYESMGQPDQSAEWAREACAVLVPEESPEAVDALFALSRSLWAAGIADAEAYFEEGRRLLAQTNEYTAAVKARRLESAALDFEQRGLRDQSAALRRDAADKRNSVPVFG